METPERIYLQIETEDYQLVEEAFVADISDATWCTDQIHDSDVEYVRKDVAVKLRAALSYRIMRAGTPEQLREAEDVLMTNTAWLDELPEAAEVWSDVVDMLEATSDDQCRIPRLHNCLDSCLYPYW